jgi:hypothetical protein
MGVREQMSKMISKFPRMLTRYMDMKRLKMRCLSSRSSLNHRGRNSEITVWFLVSILMKDLIGKWGENITKYYHQPAAPLRNVLENQPCRYLHVWTFRL